ncbi:NAD(P)H-quinone oxidoreductase [Zafaria sp. J156]|uniref:NAD(P)H-quinone oxidoreductase n=1 Tax=Zafaria sp. J156 TaxID=3116490 RepID=UPI002E7A3453|nr:NAD(P)H-quinone oxidoreductase [Zafaria sp. J156]MEE1622045.1 NAD(P)H-quinone oxidoreductase [Zafaria sp. J156]
MNAIEYTSSGGHEVIRVVERPRPEADPGHVLIKVAAAGLNRADVQQRRGVYPPPPGESDIPGLEVSGTVAAVGDGVEAYDAGAPVCALLASGGYAEYAAVPVGQVLPVPDGVGLTEAAGLPEVAATVWSNLVMEAGAARGDTVLVHGASGGIGAAAIQILKALGCTVAVTGSSPEKLEFARSLGADHLIDYTREDFPAALRERTGGHGADVVLDVVGAKYLARNLDSLATGGRLVVIGLLGGARAELDLGLLMRRRARVIGTTLRARPAAEKAEIMRQVHLHVWPLLASGALRATTDRTYPLAQVRDAHEYFDSGSHRGKVLLTM